MIFVYSLALFGLIESLRRTYEMYKNLHTASEMILITTINVLTFGFLGYIIKLGIEILKG